ncbi:MAG: hypothetical protein GX638_15850 [Crenarchaeota archaeon]|nr:hypothetical protein [Thermoproteota archaeon]
MQETVSALIVVISTVLICASVVGIASEITTQTLVNGNQQLENLSLQSLNVNGNSFNSTSSDEMVWLPIDLRLP